MIEQQVHRRDELPLLNGLEVSTVQFTVLTDVGRDLFELELRPEEVVLGHLFLWTIILLV